VNSTLALSLSIAVLGAVWAFLALGPLNGYVLVWAGFIAWGSFFHTGGCEKALVKSLAGNIYGAVIAWICFVILGSVAVPALGAAWPAIVIGATVFLLVIVAGFEPLSAVPANVYGYAALVAYTLHQPSAAPSTGPLQNLTSPNFANPLILLVVSLAAGALFGWVSGYVAKTLSSKTAAAQA
jgi:hypothetical protein